MAGPTLPVRQLVVDTLRTIPQPYSKDITDEVCRCIESDPPLMQRYEALCVGLRKWVVNNAIGYYTAEITGRRSGKSVSARSSLIGSYRKLPL